MSNYSFLNNIESVKFVINRLSENKNLSTWEKGFIASIKEYVDNNGFLSERQKQKLSDLWEKY